MSTLEIFELGYSELHKLITLHHNCQSQEQIELKEFIVH
jgi:hypothetical protein